jgi:hypothetical protein
LKPIHLFCITVVFLGSVSKSFSATSSGTLSAALKTCEHAFVKNEDPAFNTVALCDSKNRLKRVETRFKASSQAAQAWDYDKNQRIVANSTYNLAGDRVQWFIYQPEPNHRYLKWNGIHNPKKPIIKTRIRRGNGPFETELPEARLYFHPNVSSVNCINNSCLEKKPFMIDVLDSKGAQTMRRDFMKDDGALDHRLVPNYRTPMRLTGELESFSIFDSTGRLLRYYKENIGVDIPSMIRKSNLSPAETERRIQIHQNSKREPIVVIDTGFDISHPNIGYKLWSNPIDPVDGIDNDGNGWIDDLFGWYSDPSPIVTKESNEITERQAFLDESGIRVPFSHGTHVASLALRDVEDFALVGFAGDFSAHDFLNKISEFLNKKNVRFVNMSFGFGDSQSPFSMNNAARDTLESVIRDRTNTLFFVAAGNTPLDLDADGYRDYPASFQYNNLFVVGALDRGEFDESTISRSKIADFSTWGHRSVDLFAPGQDVLGAVPGGGSLKVSGTSMAAPLVMNVALKVANIAPKLSILEIKELMMKTVYIPALDRPMLALSGGALSPRRAYLAARLAARGMSVEASALEARRLDLQDPQRDPKDEVDLNQLVQFWRSRKL